MNIWLCMLSIDSNRYLTSIILFILIILVYLYVIPDTVGTIHSSCKNFCCFLSFHLDILYSLGHLYSITHAHLKFSSFVNVCHLLTSTLKSNSMTWTLNLEVLLLCNICRCCLCKKNSSGGGGLSAKTEFLKEVVSMYAIFCTTLRYYEGVGLHYSSPVDSIWNKIICHS